MRARTTPTLLLAAGWLAGCCLPARPVPPALDPGEIAPAYAGKLLAGDLAGARQLLAEPLRATTTEPELSAFLAAGGQELRALLAQVARGGLEVVSFRVRLPGGGEAEIRPEQGGELRLAGGALCPAPQGSPAVALLAFARALEAQDCAALLTTAPPATLARLGRDRLMEGCRARLERSRDLVQPLREAVARLPAPTGDRLTLALEPAGKLVLVRQDGRWFVEDLDAPAAAGQGGGNP